MSGKITLMIEDVDRVLTVEGWGYLSYDSVTPGSIEVNFDGEATQTVEYHIPTRPGVTFWAKYKDGPEETKFVTLEDKRVIGIGRHTWPMTHEQFYDSFYVKGIGWHAES